VSATPLLELVNVSKAFGSTQALDGVSFELFPGEVHVLAGENGAGKSTLIKILSGVHGEFSGELRVSGKPARFVDPAAALKAGIATIHQELSLLPNLSIADNLVLSGQSRPFSLLRRMEELTRARKVLSDLDLDLNPDARVEELTLSERQLLEIARALAHAARVLILDEPTSALSEPEARILFERLERLRDAGVGILYISHRLEEIYRLADRITVLRDGKGVLTRPASQLSSEELVAAMVGRASTKAAPMPDDRTKKSPLLSVRDLRDTGRPALASLSFELGAGEIVGLAGQRGSGAARTLHVLFGNGRQVSGEVRLGGALYAPGTPGAALERGVVLLPSDRAQSVFAALSVQKNATLSSLRRFSRAGLVARARERAAVADRVRQLALKAPSLDSEACALSGGNQQKLALLRCLLAEPAVLLLDDPTRGIDVGARADLYTTLRALSRRGVGILMYSSDLDELCEIADRILVLFEGRIVARVERSEATRERLLAPLMGANA